MKYHDIFSHIVQLVAISSRLGKFSRLLLEQRVRQSCVLDVRDLKARGEHYAYRFSNHLSTHVSQEI